MLNTDFLPLVFWRPLRCAIRTVSTDGPGGVGVSLLDPLMDRYRALSRKEVRILQEHATLMAINRHAPLLDDSCGRVNVSGVRNTRGTGD